MLKKQSASALMTCGSVKDAKMAMPKRTGWLHSARSCHHPWPAQGTSRQRPALLRKLRRRHPQRRRKLHSESRTLVIRTLLQRSCRFSAVERGNASQGTERPKPSRSGLRPFNLVLGQGVEPDVRPSVDRTYRPNIGCCRSRDRRPAILPGRRVGICLSKLRVAAKPSRIIPRLTTERKLSIPWGRK